MKFRVCPYCGCALDFGERCDCREEENKETMKKEKDHEKPVTVIRSGYRGQYTARNAI